MSILREGFRKDNKKELEKRFEKIYTKFKVLTLLCILITMFVMPIHIISAAALDQSENGQSEIPLGNPEGMMPIPEEAQLEDVSNPDHIIGTGTPESCTAEAFTQAVALGGTIVFNGGTEPFTITLTETAKIFNNANPDVIIDGGGLVTLSGGDHVRILYMNTADPEQVWTTSHAQNQDHPRLTVQNLHFTSGNSISETEYTGGGAIWVRGGRFKVINCRFTNNVCGSLGPDIGGGAIRVFDQYEDLPVYIINSTFGGAPGLGNIGSNGGAISSIGVSWTIINSVFSYNEAIGNGGNPARPGTPGGGSGGAIYNDGNEMRLTILGSRIEYNQVEAHGSGIFFVTNNHTGDIVMDNTIVAGNIGGSWYPVQPDISCHSDTVIRISNSVITETATPNKSAVYVDSMAVLFEAYTINSNNYFKLRDLAQILNDSDKQFEVTWDNIEKSILMYTNQSYTRVGNELNISTNLEPENAIYVTPTLYLDGQVVYLKAYIINGNHYFKLRDVAAEIDFGVTWDGQAGRIGIQTDTGY
jgi:hypothetical protein